MTNIAVYGNKSTEAGWLENRLIHIAWERGLAMDIDVFYDEQALERGFLSKEIYDILFLIIQSEQEGMTAARNIRKRNENVLIIYISEYDVCWQEAFEVNAFDLIKKPLDEARLRTCFLKAYKKLCALAYYFDFHYKKEWVKVATAEILYFESSGRKILVRLSNGITECFNGKLNDVEAKLRSGHNKIPFLRIHQSYLVNFNFIRSLSKLRLRLMNETILPVSAERYPEIRKRFGILLEGRF